MMRVVNKGVDSSEPKMREGLVAVEAFGSVESKIFTDAGLLVEGWVHGGRKLLQWFICSAFLPWI